MSRFWSPLVHGLSPYVPGEQPKLPHLIKLNTNENPYPPSPKAIAAMQEELGESLRLYPDPGSERLKGAVAEYYAIDSRQVFVGNGSDEVLAHAFAAFFRQSRPLLFPDISYSFYPVYCGLYDIQYETVPLDEGFRLRVEDYRRPNGGIVIANPNAPTGELLPLSAIERLLQEHPDSLVLVDEAYIDFGGQSAVGLIDRFANLLICQTLSKSRSLAGLRVGLALGQAELIEGLERVKNSFNSYPLDRLAIAGASAAFADREYFQSIQRRVVDGREQLASGLQACGFEVLPSAANFLFVRHSGWDAVDIAARLRQRDIIVRHFKLPRISQFLRISVGTPEHNEALLEALRAFCR